MIWLFGLALLAVISFGVVLFFGAPYLPTLNPQVEQALKLLELRQPLQGMTLQQGQVLLELGCGDGKVLVAAAEKGFKVVGYELNPLLAFIAWLRTRKYNNQVKVICGNFWTAEWPKADAVFTFLLPRYMSKLDAKMQSYKYKPVSLVSIAFAITDKPIDRQKNGVNLYLYK